MLNGWIPLLVFYYSFHSNGIVLLILIFKHNWVFFKPADRFLALLYSVAACDLHTFENLAEKRTIFAHFNAHIAQILIWVNNHEHLIEEMHNLFEVHLRFLTRLNQHFYLLRDVSNTVLEGERVLIQERSEIEVPFVWDCTVEKRLSRLVFILSFSLFWLKLMVQSVKLLVKLREQFLVDFLQDFKILTKLLHLRRVFIV